MKKTLALLMALMLAVSALAAAAVAEEETGTTDQVSSATVRAGHGGRHQAPGAQMPGIPDQNNGQNVQTPDQNGQNVQTPDQNGQDAQAPGRNRQFSGKGGKGGLRGNRFDSRNGTAADNRTGKPGKCVDPDLLLADGVITQEVYDAINSYLNEKAQQMPQPAADPAEPAESTAPAEETGVPALPENAPDEQAVANEQLLKELLDSGAITQDQYDQLLKTVVPPELPVSGT